MRYVVISCDKYFVRVRDFEKEIIAQILFSYKLRDMTPKNMRYFQESSSHKANYEIRQLLCSTNVFERIYKNRHLNPYIGPY